MPSLAELVPEIAAYRQSHQVAQQQGMGQLQQMGALQGIVQKQQAMQQEQEMKAMLARVSQETGGNPVLMVPALLRMGTPASITLAEKMKGLLPKPAEDRVVAPGGAIIRPDMSVGYQAPFKPDKEKEDWSEPFQLGGAWVQRSSTGQVRQSVAREPQVKVTNEAPVTPVTIQDPDDPSATIIIDGRTGKRFGKGPKMTQAGAIDAKASLAMTGLGADLQSAEDLLTGVVRTSDGQVVKGNKPTGSLVGSLYDAAAGAVGLSPAGSAEADSLKVVAARLISKVPRFEGAQSDKDVALYKQAAGDAGNEKLPTGRRLAAIKTMRSIYSGYESGQRGRLIGNRRASDSAGSPKVVNFADLPE